MGEMREGDAMASLKSSPLPFELPPMTISNSRGSRRSLRGVAAVALIASVAFAACSTAEDGAESAESASAAVPVPSAATHAAAVSNPADSSLITVYKSPTCGCCAEWVDHMREHGFRVAVTDVGALPPVKRTYKVPEDVATCHTGSIGGYFVEGHVPAEDVRRLLRDRPDIIGIAVPDMPQGSPGMETGTIEKYDVIAIGKDGSRKVWATHGG